MSLAMTPMSFLLFGPFTLPIWPSIIGSPFDALVPMLFVFAINDKVGVLENTLRKDVVFAASFFNTDRYFTLFDGQELFL